MIKILELTLPPEEVAGENFLLQKIASSQGLQVSDIKRYRILKRSIDSRSKRPVFVLKVQFTTGNDILEEVNITRSFQNVSSGHEVVIIGAGPAGLFAALKLLELGVKPVIFERGKMVRDRRRDLAILNRDRIVNNDSNYCFGEGGAGTYSDGKLYTRSGSKEQISKLLDCFIQFGASHDIKVDAHPHIGTNKLPGIIENIRQCILDHGGEIHFGHRLTGIQFDSGGLKQVVVKALRETGTPLNHKCKALILATGHSARDIYSLLHESDIAIEAKPFALGVRVEHPQKLIDSIRYRCSIKPVNLPPAAYNTAVQVSEKGVYSFCMCPGGIITTASTAPGELVVNGWSPSKRNNPFANSGFVVSVDEDDFKPFATLGPLRAMAYQSEVEKKAFVAGGSDLTAPAIRITDFLNNKLSSTLPSCSYIPGVIPCDLNDVLPIAVAETLKKGIALTEKKMKGFVTEEAILVATESRTSSPVRIPRDRNTLMHPDVMGLYPCGEGAGYAGGIMSAAMDGERCAEAAAAFVKKES